MHSSRFFTEKCFSALSGIHKHGSFHRCIPLLSSVWFALWDDTLTHIKTYTTVVAYSESRVIQRINELTKICTYVYTLVLPSCAVLLLFQWRGKESEGEIGINLHVYNNNESTNVQMNV